MLATLLSSKMLSMVHFLYVVGTWTLNAGMMENWKPTNVRTVRISNEQKLRKARCERRLLRVIKVKKNVLEPRTKT